MTDWLKYWCPLVVMTCGMLLFVMGLACVQDYDAKIIVCAFGSFFLTMGVLMSVFNTMWED